MIIFEKFTEQDDIDKYNMLLEAEATIHQLEKRNTIMEQAIIETGAALNILIDRFLYEEDFYIEDSDIEKIKDILNKGVI